MREDRRLVTALFADLRGSTALAEQHDIEDVRELIGWFTHAAISAVEEFGGVVKDLAGDGVLALFGAPTTREDDPERAVRAALAFQAAMVAVSRRAATELGLADVAARVGIETGRVVAGPVGSGGHVEYGVTGDAVNVAARLQSLSPIGGVLVGPETYRQAGPHVRWGEPLLLELKGRDAPVRARVALGVTPGPDSVPAGAGAGAVAATRVVGRDRERAALAGWLGELAGGTGRVVLVSGDAGVGKSALVRHAACGRGGLRRADLDAHQLTVGERDALRRSHAAAARCRAAGRRRRRPSRAAARRLRGGAPARGRLDVGCRPRRRRGGSALGRPLHPGDGDGPRRPGQVRTAAPAGDHARGPRSGGPAARRLSGPAFAAASGADAGRRRARAARGARGAGRAAARHRAPGPGRRCRQPVVRPADRARPGGCGPAAGELGGAGAVGCPRCGDPRLSRAADPVEAGPARPGRRRGRHRGLCARAPVRRGSCCGTAGGWGVRR